MLIKQKSGAMTYQLHVAVNRLLTRLSILDKN